LIIFSPSKIWAFPISSSTLLYDERRSPNRMPGKCGHESTKHGCHLCSTAQLLIGQYNLSVDIVVGFFLNLPTLPCWQVWTRSSQRRCTLWWSNSKKHCKCIQFCHCQYSSAWSLRDTFANKIIPNKINKICFRN
jgi:hypothetical protein